MQFAAAASQRPEQQHCRCHCSHAGRSGYPSQSSLHRVSHSNLHHSDHSHGHSGHSHGHSKHGQSSHSNLGHSGHAGHSRRMSSSSASSAGSRSGGSYTSSLGYPVDPSRGQFLIGHVQNRDTKAVGNKPQFLDNSLPHPPPTPERYRSPKRRSSASSTSPLAASKTALNSKTPPKSSVDKWKTEKERIAAHIRHQQQKEIERYELEKHRHRQMIKEREMTKERHPPNPRRHSAPSITQHTQPAPQISRNYSFPHPKVASPPRKPKHHVTFAL